MILLSSDAIKRIRNNQFEAWKIRNEFFTSLLLNEVVQGVYMVGNDKPYPDLIDKDKNIGFEITQCDLPEDLNYKYVYECLRDCDYRYEPFIKTFNNDKVDLADYDFLLNSDGIVVGITTKSIPRDPYYFRSIFKDAIKKKITKLANGYYSGCKVISLVLFSFSRLKDSSDVNVIIDTYNEVLREFVIHFATLYLITSSAVYVYENDNLSCYELNPEKLSGITSFYNQIIEKVKAKNTLFSEYPDLCFEWDENKNAGKHPIDFGQSSDAKIWWLCENNHSYLAVINKRTKRNNGCPYCSGHQVMAGFNDLETTHPMIAKQWDFEKNDHLTPSMVSKGSIKKVWWKCPNGHSYLGTINGKKEQNDCPYCAHRLVIKGETDLATTNPTLAREWHPTKNGSLTPADVFENSDKKVWWICPQGHSYLASIHHRSKDNNGCPECNKEKKVSFPEKLLFYYLSKCFEGVFENHNCGLPNNGNIDIFLDKYCIGIEYDGEHWHKDIKKDLTKNNYCDKLGILLIRIREKGCPLLNSSSYDCYIDKGDYEKALEFIKGILYTEKGLNFIFDYNLSRDSSLIDSLVFSKTKENCLVNYPEILKEWDYEKNIGVKPEFVSAGSTKKYWWKCKQGHSWYASANNRSRGRKCPYCSNRLLLKGYNDLLTTHPELNKEWDYSKNHKKPDEVMHGSAEKVWWKCVHGHSYKIEIREKRSGYCPICEGNIIQEGVNDLASLFPNLIKEWDYEKNIGINPNKLSPFSNKKVWWKCNCCGYCWQQPIYRRTRDKTRCIKCNNK